MQISLMPAALAPAKRCQVHTCSVNMVSSDSAQLSCACLVRIINQGNSYFFRRIKKKTVFLTESDFLQHQWALLETGVVISLIFCQCVKRLFRIFLWYIFAHSTLPNYLINKSELYLIIKILSFSLNCIYTIKTKQKKTLSFWNSEIYIRLSVDAPMTWL